MTSTCSCKLALCAVFLLQTLPVTPVLAENTAPEGCDATQEQDADGNCCRPDLMDVKEGEKMCFEKPTATTVAVAFTLIGSFTFIIALNFAVNWPAEHMRKYAYKVISSTVSIFCAVLMFQCINGLIEEWIVEPLELTGWWQFGLDYLQMLLWYIIMQVVIAKASGAMKPVNKRAALLDPRKTRKKDIEGKKERVGIACQCFGGVLAHLTGFASINLWASLQQQSPFNSTPLMALSATALAIVSKVIVQWTTGKCRNRISMADSNKDWFESKWDESCVEAADDVVGLTLSVMIVNALRMAINGMNPAASQCLPNEEQKEEGEECEYLLQGHRTSGQAFCLRGSGYVFLFMLFIVQWMHWKLCKEDKEEEELAKHVQRASTEHEEPNEAEEEPDIVERVVHVFMITLSMASCWCLFHADKQDIAVMSPHWLGKKKNECFALVIVALEVSCVSWMSIWVLHKLQNLPDKYTPPSIDSSMNKIIDSISLLIGFAWEQTFDVAVGNLANSFRHDWGKHAPAIAKFILATLCCSIVFLAWKWYILPFVVKEGWRFNYVFSGQDLYKAAHSVAQRDHNPVLKERVLPILQSLSEEGQQVCELEGYRVLPAEPTSSLEERLKKAEVENAKLQALLSQNMKTMLSSLQALQNADKQPSINST